MKAKEPIVISEELDWDNLESFIERMGSGKYDLTSGKDEIIRFLQSNYKSFNTDFVSDLDLISMKENILSSIKDPLTEEPPTNETKSLYFGIFTAVDDQINNGIDTKVFYVSGSSVTPVEAPDDWAVDQVYFPKKRYVLLDEYIAIESELDKYTGAGHTDIEQILYNGLTNLVLANSTEEIKRLSNGIEYIGSGFDEGPCFVIKKR